MSEDGCGFGLKATYVVGLGPFVHADVHIEQVANLLVGLFTTVEDDSKLASCERKVLEEM